jgi:hypothetical protein
MRVLRSILVGVFGAAVAAASACAGTITFADGDFGPEWSLSTYDGAAGGQASNVVTYFGNPLNSWEVHTTTNAYTASAILNSNFIYDPSTSGAIASLDIALQYNRHYAFGQGQAVHSVLARQAGSTYVADYFTTGPSDFNLLWYERPWLDRVTTGLTVTDFSLAAGAGALDFSAAGAPIEFGFSSGNTSGQNIIIFYDNYDLTINTANVPLAPALPLLATGIGALFFTTRSKRK